MFASEVKILTLSATTNVTGPKNHHNHHNNHQHHQNNSNTQQKTLSSPKLKYLTTTPITTTTTTNKYQNNNNNSNSNNKNAKKHHNNNNNNYNNSYNSNNNNNSTSSLNRKKYYQQQQQQKQFLNNNNSAFVKNQNITTVPTTTQKTLAATTTVDPLILTSKTLASDCLINDCQDIYNNNIIINNNNSNNCTPPTINVYTNDSTSISQPICADSEQPPTEKELFLNATQLQLTPTAAATNNITTTTTTTTVGKQNKHHSHHNNCNSCWTNYTKSQHQAASNKVKHSATTCNSNNFQEFIAKAKNNTNTSNSSSNKKKSYWKNQINNNNNLLGLDSKNKSQPNQALEAANSIDATKLSENSENFYPLNGSVGSVVSRKTASTLKNQQIPCKTLAAALSTTAMTTALATAAAAASNSPRTNSPPTATGEPSAANSTKTKTNVVAIASTACTTTTTPSLPSPSTSASLVVAAVATTTAQPVATTAPATATAAVPSSVQTAPTSPPNSYTLDFLHSVGVQMTGGANIGAALKASNSTNHNNNINNMPARKTSYNYTNVRHNRYLSGGGQQQHGNHYQQHDNHYQHHHNHHQPQQLTIASFMQKELTDSFAAGSSSSGSNNNNYENQTPQPQYASQQQRYQNYYQQYQQQQHHHQQPHNYTSLSHAFNVVTNEARYASNGGNIAGRQSYHNVYNNSSGSGGSQQHNSRHNQQNNAATNHSQQQQQSSQQYQQQSKKPAYASSSTSSCSSSSSSSTSSISSQTSATSSYNRQQQQQQQQQQQPQQHSSSKSSSSNQNLTIETLPSKSRYASSHRGHRLHHQQNQHHHHHHMHPHYHHQPQHHHQQPGASTTPTTPHHQNFYNLTYVATDSLTVPPSPTTAAATVSATNLTVRACSPCSPMLTVKTDNPALLINLNHHHQHQQQLHQNSNNNNRYYQPQQAVPFTQQQHYHNNQAKMLNSASGSPSASPTPPPPTIICCSQLDEASTTAAAVAAATSNESLHSSAATSSISNSIAGNEYDSDSTSSTHSTSLASAAETRQQEQQQQLQCQKFKQLKSSSLSSSSSASSTTSVSSAHENVIAPPMLPSPIDFTYAFSLQQFPQHFSNHQQILSPQQQHHYRNGVVSLINLTTNYADEEVNTLPQLHHHPQPQQQIYFTTSGEHLNVAAAAAAVNSGYWSPSQNSNFIYSTASNIFTTVAAPLCAPSTASLSPRISERDDTQQQSQQQSEQHIPSSQFKRSQVAASTSTLQRNTQINSSGAMRLRGRSQQHQTQQQQQQQQLQHPFQQNNLFYGGSSQHLRSSSTSSAHDFFSHTPPDRFLARAHLIEAKEMPHTLLNNSKWDMLSQGIWDKFVCSQQTEETFKQKMRLWRYLYIFIKNTYPRYGLYLVGSTISGFGADTSDVDMCLVSRSPPTMEPRQEALLNLNALRDCLAKSGEFENFNLIEAKVPILRFRDRMHQLEVDLNYNNCVGIKNTHLLYCYSQLDWRLRPLVLVTKLWAQYHNINNAKNMTISSYSLVLMVIHFLQYAVSPSVLPCLHDMFPDKFPLLRSNDFGYIDMNESIGPHESKNNQSVGELFLNFLEYYSCFDYTQFAISIRTGGLMSINVCRQAKSLKNDIHQWKELCIEEPFDLTNTARSVYDFETFERVKAVFIASWRILQETLDINAVFSPITLAPTSILSHAATTNATFIGDLTPRTTKSVADSEKSTESDAATEELIVKEIKYANNNNNNNNNSNNTSSSQNNKNTNSNSSNNNSSNSHNNLTALIS